MLKGRLGLATARIPHVDRHGLLTLHRGQLFVEDGCLHFTSAGSDALPPGTYPLPYQSISFLLIGPGVSITHDALRLLARHSTGLCATGDDGVRMYASMPFGPDDSTLARRQASLWANPTERIRVARHMYAIRMNENLLPDDINALRGIEGHRMKALYAQLAQKHNIDWRGRRYDRQDPEAADLPNQAINHAATAVEAAAHVAVAVAGALPQLGFIHEASGVSFCLDIADLFRDSFTLPIAFQATRSHLNDPRSTLEATTRKLAGARFRHEHLIPTMIDRIKELLHDHDPHHHT